MDLPMVIIGARKRPVEPLAASEAQELSILRARTAAVIKKHCQLRQVEAHISRAMRVWVELDQGEKEPSLARIAALFSECLPKTVRGTARTGLDGACPACRAAGAD